MKIKKLTAAMLAAGGLSLSAVPAHAVVTLELEDFFGFNPSGDLTDSNGDGVPDSTIAVEKFTLSGYSHVDNTFNTATSGTFIESGILQIDGYVNPLDDTVVGIDTILGAGESLYLTWGGSNTLTGTFAVTGSEADITFDAGKSYSLVLDTAPSGSLLVEDSSGSLITPPTEDSSSFLGLADGLTTLATFSTIAGATNTETNTFERSAGSFDIDVGAGDGEFVIWGAMDVEAGYFFDVITGVDLDTVDAEIAADGTVTETGLQSRTSVDAQQTPFSFRDGTSTEGPGIDDVLADTNVGTAFNPNPDDPDGLADPSQEDNFEAAIAAIHGGAVPDFQQTQFAPGVLEDFFVFHVGDEDIQTVPEPGTLALAGMGLAFAGVAHRRRKNKKA